MASMEALISKIAERLSSQQYQSETAVREAIVLPILQALNWDVYDPDSVVREFPLGQRRVDYALSTNPPHKQAFIEVKAVGQSVGADRQLFEYAFHEGIPFAILTDGKEWNFFLPGEQGSYEERRIQKLDMLERPAGDACKILRRYLQFERMKSGEAINDARFDYQNIARRRTAAVTVPNAWKALLSDADDLLIDLITEKVEAMCGFRPGAEDVEDFLAALLKQAIPTKPILSPQPAGAFTKLTTLKGGGQDGPAPVSETGVTYRIFNNERHARSAIEALIEILKTLAGKNPRRARSKNYCWAETS